MLPTSPMRRVLTPTSSEILPARRRAPSMSTPARRQIGTTVSELPAEEGQHVPQFHQIMDIFDAPARLGESSKMLARSSSMRRPAPPPPVHKGAGGPVQPLPSPIIFDGPTRPRVAKASLNADRMHNVSTMASALPAPETFEGPSRLRLYAHDVIRDTPQVLNTGSSSLVMLGLAGGAGLLGWNQLNTDNPNKHQQISQDT